MGSLVKKCKHQKERFTTNLQFYGKK